MFSLSLLNISIQALFVSCTFFKNSISIEEEVNEITCLGHFLATNSNHRHFLLICSHFNSKQFLKIIRRKRMDAATDFVETGSFYTFSLSLWVYSLWDGRSSSSNVFLFSLLSNVFLSGSNLTLYRFYKIVSRWLCKACLDSLKLNLWYILSASS